MSPPNFDAAKKYPMLLLIHGGPQQAWTDAWGYRWNQQVMAAPGYVVAGDQSARVDWLRRRNLRRR